MQPTPLGRRSLGIIALCLIVLAIIFIEYQANWTWTGFQNKTLWDWMQLLIVPIALALVAVWFNRGERKNEQAVALDNQRNTILQAYLDRMSELLLKEDLRTSQSSDEVRNVARVHTVTVLTQLDYKRNKYVLAFLRESGLLRDGPDGGIVSLKAADLSRADLETTSLSGVNLSASNLSYANLFGTPLIRTNLGGATLRGATLKYAMGR